MILVSSWGFSVEMNAGLKAKEETLHIDWIYISVMIADFVFCKLIKKETFFISLKAFFVYNIFLTFLKYL